LNLSTREVGKHELIDLMLRDPNLIKRPVLVDGKKCTLDSPKFDGMIYSIRRAFLLLAAAAFFMYAQPAPCIENNSTGTAGSMSELLDSVVTETYNYNFNRAIAVTNRMISLYPDKPEGYIYRCGIYSKMLAEGCFRSPDSAWQVYNLNVQRACALARRDVEAHPDDVESLFHYASALVYRSRYEAEENDWFGLMSDGVKSRDLLEKP